MFFQFIMFAFYLVFAGLAIGTLLAVKVWYSLPAFLFMTGLICFGAYWIGALAGPLLFGWLPLAVIKWVIIVFCLGLIYYFYKQFHPSYGYFPFHGWLHWVILTVFFFLGGVNFAVTGLTAWLLFLLLPVFFAALLGGFLLMENMKTNYRQGGAYILYLPLVLFFFLAIATLIQ
ncbi:hypothetical protein SAMN05421736_102225 [Evansella caseinilytica]|uniref:Uncharacterized protein n=1 Tax=Evansella caseinilytica TaxID=1503961 RepID=A0A1H3KR13_9BACI|nr:hypothetical protein [Evansella caseinilytica]SDY54449.1 hypothetical protein SAMN05421736_102225 [Evansella caseinilytica]